MPSVTNPAENIRNPHNQDFDPQKPHIDRAVFVYKSGALGGALSSCSSQVCPANPPYGCTRESNRSCGHSTFIVRLFAYPRFVKEQRRKISLVGVLYPHTPKLLRDVIDMLLYVT